MKPTERSENPLLLLAGNPNSGKSTLFNALTGARQKIANYPGVTVEKKFGQAVTESGRNLDVVDLPGQYSMRPSSPDEEIACQVIRQLSSDSKGVIVGIVIDITHLERSLGLVFEIKALNVPVVLIANMMDRAVQLEMGIDLEKLAERIGAPVLPVTARNGGGISALADQAYEFAAEGVEARDQEASGDEVVEMRPIQRFRKVDAIVKDTVSAKAKEDPWTKRLDRVFLHPFGGGAILAVLLFLIFQAVFTWSEAPMTWIEDGVAWFGDLIGSLLEEGLLQDLLVDGIVAGVGAVVVFLPQIVILFLFIFLMEGSGYMARAAVILDRGMAVFGLQGRSFVPLLSSFACAIPGIMATRTIKEPGDRLATLLVAPLMTCSARLPVYVLLIGAFIPNKSVLGLFGLQGVVMFGLFLFGIVAAMVSAFVTKSFVLKGRPAPFLLELPNYQWPDMGNVLASCWVRVRLFLKKAGTIIMGVSVAIWVLSTFPQAPEDWQEPAINYSFAGRAGHAIEPLVRPLGFDWRIATGLIPGFGAREVIVGALATIFAIESEDEEEQALSLQQKIASTWPLATGLSLLVWYVFSPQCLATFAAMKRETMGWKWPVISFCYMLILAIFFSWVTYSIASLI